MGGRKKIYLTIPGLAVALLIAGFLWWGSDRGDSQYKIVKITRGDLQETIAATGTIEPEEVIDVGAQVAGRITEFGTDKAGKVVDYGSYVEQGTILAKIDDSLYQADLSQAQAQLQLAEAQLLQAKSKLMQAQRDWERAQKLGPSEALAKSSYDAYLSAFETARAGVGVSDAGVSQATAALSRSQQNLSYCIIRAPVSGVVIDRRVNIGQTVVSSLNAPSLFLLAKDLRKMQIWAAVNEADIGHITSGQNAAFTVDAFPTENFQGQVIKTRLNASMTQNVVTYIVEIGVDNSNLKLLPYLTANVRFLVEEKKDALLVPNAALRWSPGTNEGGGYGRGRNDTRKEGAIEKTGEKRGRFWILKSGKPVPIDVSAGLSDGSMTAISGAEIKEGLEVIAGEETEGARKSASSAGTVSPFAPQMPRGGRR